MDTKIYVRNTLMFKFNTSLFYPVGPIRAVVTDGDTIGRPCCKVHNCTRPLPTNRDHFCVDHANLKSVCVVTGCTSTAQVEYQTCTTPAHRGMEEHR